MNTAKATAEAEIRAQVDSWLQAVLAMDIERIVSHYAPDILAFDAVSQLQFQGVDAYRQHWQACLAMCRPGTMIFEMHDVHITAGDAVAFATALTRCGGTGENGAEKTGWMRMTAGYCKTDGKWSVVHEHFSAPFDMETLKVLDVQPERDEPRWYVRCRWWAPLPDIASQSRMRLVLVFGRAAIRRSASVSGDAR
jgi:uncharacterized protein (TIGR02246 family)